MTKATTPPMSDEDIKANLIETVVAKPADTVSYEITLGNKVLYVQDVPIKDNTTYLQSQFISLYSGVPDGEYEFEGTTIKVTVTTS